MGDVGKGAGMHKGRSAFQGLQQIGFERILHQHGKRSGHSQILGGDGFALLIEGHHHAPQALAQIGKVGGQGQDGHDLGGHGDVITAAA